MKRYLIGGMLMLGGSVVAQHQHHQPPQQTTAQPPDTSRHQKMDHSKHEGMDNGTKDHAGMNHEHMDHGMMSHLYSRNLPMNRNGSGTAWLPDQTPMYMNMWHQKTKSNHPWMYMLHYSVIVRHTNQNFNNEGKRGRASEFDAPNWAMGMAQRTVGQRGLLSFKLMVSLDPLTVSNGGYPLLFQSGETYQGRRLVDRQHQHDLFSEVSVGYAHAFSADADAFVYVGLPGEPALGPPAFMHRISSFNNPDSPLGHHWMDATHITFGVATAGFRYKIAKVEVSSFTGREPNENRFGFDKPRFDSYSYRLSVNPAPSLALQFSQGWLKSPEAVEPDENVKRTTASLLHSKTLGGDPNRYVSSALVWGLNRHGGENENAYLAETSLQLNRVALYGRYENIRKSSAELDLGDQLGGHQHFTINNLTLGMNYRLVRFASTDLVAGAQLTASKPDQSLETIYGKMPLSGQVYLRVTPALMPMMQGRMR